MFNTNEAIFSALADSTRRELLTTLAENSPRTATQLARSFKTQGHKISRQGITKHLDILAHAGLVQSRPQGREKHYWFTPQPLDNVSGWIEAISAKWDERLNRLKNLVENDDSL